MYKRQLTNIGLEVESVKENSGELSEFKIAKIIKVEKHPNADKLKVCDVNIGKTETLKVVCGAPNARDGLITIYAPPGAIIPKTKFQLKIAKIRGVESRGMLCSESELNISDESDGIIELNTRENEIGKSYFKSKSEKAIDIAITPNRPDCLGIRGIARDLSSTGIGKLITSKRKKFKQNFKHIIKTSILKDKHQGCMTFGSCYIKNISNKESPEWLKNKISIEDHLKYKFVMCVEGVDVATNLKWVMSSNSIAVMPRPKIESWFMENMLIPEKHYIEIKEDYSDLESKIKYYIKNPEKCKRIIKNANDYVVQFKNKRREDLISLLVLEKYFHFTGQQEKTSFLDY